MPKKYDVIIIGAGIVGSLVARFLSKYQLDILLIEKEANIGMGASSANSAILHAGYDPIPGSNKALTNVMAVEMWPVLSQELGIGYSRCGDYVVAVTAEEVQVLEELLARGQRNGVAEIEIISGTEMRRREPLICPDIVAALWVPSGAIGDPFAATVAAAENAVMNGVELMCGTAFEDFLMEGNQIIGVRTNQGDFHCRWASNAAGLYADEVMHKAGVRPEFIIRPRRGEYVILDQAEFQLTQTTVIFLTPTDKGKGITVSGTLHGNVIVGPNANFVDSKENKDTTTEGLQEIWEGGNTLIPTISRKHIIAQFAGLRATGNAPSPDPALNYNQDFIIEIPNNVSGLVNLGGIESPGFTAAPAIALKVIELLQNAGENLQEKPDWNPVRAPRPVFRNLSREEQAALIAKNPAYGRIICRCEMVTEGEILAEIHAPIPATTYDALKRRTWLGTGRCQGGFDIPRVVAILAEALAKTPEEVTKKGGQSEFLYRSTKAVDQDYLNMEALI
ncbi:MAG: NAD(P)/FAD-dependent oxidoreductase [Chloroflexi bacterium]|nr:NAD(P)/FAD-dependent oxidoreductase [Chloroflexota bacterium]